MRTSPCPEARGAVDSAAGFSVISFACGTPYTKAAEKLWAKEKPTYEKMQTTRSTQSVEIKGCQLYKDASFTARATFAVLLAAWHHAWLHVYATLVHQHTRMDGSRSYIFWRNKIIS
jgi:hypothetical protein